MPRFGPECVGIPSAPYVRSGGDLFVSGMGRGPDDLVRDMRLMGINGPERDRGALHVSPNGVTVVSFGLDEAALNRTVLAVRSAAPNHNVKGELRKIDFRKP